MPCCKCIYPHTKSNAIYCIMVKNDQPRHPSSPKCKTFIKILPEKQKLKKATSNGEKKVTFHVHKDHFLHISSKNRVKGKSRRRLFAGTCNRWCSARKWQGHLSAAKASKKKNQKMGMFQKQTKT